MTMIFLFNHIWGKTLRDGDQNLFGIRRNPQTIIFPIKGIEQCMEVARQVGTDFTRGYLFRPTTLDKIVQDSTFSSTVAEARLKQYLKEMKADDGQTLCGFRSGCAITLSLTGAELSETIDHVGCESRRHTALYYLQLAEVFNPSGASAKLASSSGEDRVAPWRDINELKRFVCAYPTSVSRKRAQPIQ